MAKLNSTKKIVVEDYPEDIRSWFAKLATSLNPYLSGVYTALTNGLTYEDNLKGDVINLTFLAGETMKTAKWSLKEKPTSVILGKCLTSGGNLPTNQITLSWRMTNDGLQLKLYNTAAGTKYVCTFCAQI